MDGHSGKEGGFHNDYRWCHEFPDQPLSSEIYCLLVNIRALCRFFVY